MSLAGKQVKVYFRVAFVALVACAVSMVLLMNRSHAAPVWFFWLTDAARPVNVVWLMLCSSAATVIAWWTIASARGLVRDARELREARRAELAAKAQREREAELNERERRLDEKLKQAEATAPTDSWREET